MYIARMGQLMRTDTSLLYCLRDEGIDPGELCIAQLDIYTAQNVDGIRNRFPVERRILGNVKTQVLIQRLNCLLRTALCVSGVDLIIRVFIVDIQITVPDTDTRRISPVSRLILAIMLTSAFVPFPTFICPC